MSADTSAMNSIVEDPVLGPEMLSLLTRELKAARIRNEQLEADLKNTDIAKYKQRADSAEVAFEALKKSYEDTRTVNQALHARVDREAKRKEVDSTTGRELDEVRKRLDDAEIENRLSRASLEESGDSKKKRSKKPIKMLIDKMVSTDEIETQPIEPTDVTELQNRLEKYRQKYKTEKASKKELAEIVKNLESELSNLRAENEDRLNKLSAERQVMLPPQTFGPDPSWEDLNSSMMDLSNSFDNKHLPHNKLRPICHRSVDLKAYLSSDPQTSMYANKFLYLPDLLVWCSGKINALALGPFHIYGENHTNGWRRQPTFQGLYDKTFCLFEKRGELVYYVGTFKAICLLGKYTGGISFALFDPTGDTTQEQALRPFSSSRCLSSLIDSAVFKDPANNNNTRTRKPPSRSEIRDLYLNGTLRVEPLGLQKVAFDDILYQNLIKRFQGAQPTVVIPDATTSSVSPESVPAPASASASSAPNHIGDSNGKRKGAHSIVPRGLEGRDSSSGNHSQRDGGRKKRRISEGSPAASYRGRNHPKNRNPHYAQSSSTDNPASKQRNKNDSKR